MNIYGRNAKRNTISDDKRRTLSISETNSGLKAKGDNLNTSRVHKVNITGLIDLLKSYKPHCDVMISDLPEEKQEQLKNISEIAKLMRETASYGDLVNNIKKIFEEPNVPVKSGTVRSFFIGCFTVNNPQSILGSCSSLCAGSILPPKSSGLDQCDKHVFYFDGVNLTHHHEAESSKSALIYITGNGKYNGFTVDHINKLKSLSIEDVSITIINGELKDELESVKVDSLYTVKAHAPSPSKKNVKHDKSNFFDDKTLRIIFIGFIVLVIVLAVIWFLHSGNFASAPAEFRSPGYDAVSGMKYSNWPGMLSKTFY